MIEITVVHWLPYHCYVLALRRSENRELAMPTIASKRRSSFGIDCVQCDNELIAPERSEYRDERLIVHLWHCPKCDCCFEVISLADTKSVKDIMTKTETIIEDIMRSGEIFPLPLAA